MTPVLKHGLNEQYDLVSVEHVPYIMSLVDNEDEFAEAAWGMSGGAFPLQPSDFKKPFVPVTVPWESTPSYLRNPYGESDGYQMGRVIKKIHPQRVYRFAWMTQVIWHLMQFDKEWRRLHLDKSSDLNGDACTKTAVGRLWTHYYWYIYIGSAGYQSSYGAENIAPNTRTFGDLLVAVLAERNGGFEYKAINLFTKPALPAGVTPRYY